MELHRALRELAHDYGPTVFQSPDQFRAALDDYFDEGSISQGEANLLTDALRLDGVVSLDRLLAGGATPDQALQESALRLARSRGGADVNAARWAIAMLGFALDRLPESAVTGLRAGGPAAAPTVTTPGDAISREPSKPSAATAPAAPAAAATEPRPSDPPPKIEERRPTRRLAPWVSLAVATAAIAAVVAVLLVRASSEDPAAGPSAATAGADEPIGDQQDGRQTPPTTSSAAESRADPEDHSEDDSESPKDGRRRSTPFSCWDGTETVKLSTCGVPTGAAGARWLFPDTSAQNCTSTTAGDRLFHLECTIETPSGETAYVKYSEWKSWDEAWDHYSEEPGVIGGLQEWLGLHLWLSRSSTEPCCSYKAAVLYPGVPWSATIYAASDSARERLLHRMEFRAPGTLAGERSK